MDALNPENKARQKSDFATAIKVAKFLETVCRKEGDYAVYEKGYDDHSIADKFSVSFRTVANVRRQTIGPMRSVAENEADESLEKRITDIEEYLTRKNPNWRDGL